MAPRISRAIFLLAMSDHNSSLRRAGRRGPGFVADAGPRVVAQLFQQLPGFGRANVFQDADGTPGSEFFTMWAQTLGEQLFDATSRIQGGFVIERLPQGSER